MQRLHIVLFYLFIFSFLLIVSKLGATVHIFPAFNPQDDLLEEIKDRIAEYEEEPQDAYIDRVWKKTPGRNGITVLVNESYEKMKKEGKFDETLLKFKETPPSVHLKDLPPAPIYRGHPDKMMVAFLINVSWGTEHIPTILKTLNKHDVKATFFIEGKWAKENKEHVQMIHEQGHLIGSHAYNHPDMATLNQEQILQQINDTNEIIEAIV